MERTAGHMAGALRFASGPLWTGVLTAAVFAVATEARLAHLPSLPVVADWEPFLRQTNDLAFGRPQVAEASPFYTSIPNLVFAALIRWLKHPDRIFPAWSMVAALGPSLLVLALRPVAGWPAALVGGLLLAVAPSDVRVTVGIKSPYIVSTFGALGCVGLWATAARRAWGPPLLLGGAACAAGCHAGYAVLALGASAVALVGAALLPGWRRWVSLLGSLAVGFGLLGLVWWMDRVHLEFDIRTYLERGPPPRQAMGFVDLRTVALRGLSLTPRAVWWLEGSGVLVGVGLLARGVWALTRRVTGARPPPEPAPPLGVALLAGALLGLGALPYYVQAKHSGYLEDHHLVGLLPWAIFAVGALGRAALPPWPRWLGPVVAAACLGGWLWAHRDVDLSAGPPPTGDVRRRVLFYDPLKEVAMVIRDDARGLRRQPLTFSWMERGGGQAASLGIQIINELARLGWPADDLPPTCYLLTRPGVGDTLAGWDVRWEVGAQDVEVLRFTTCSQLAALSERLCAGDDGAWLVRRRRQYPGADPDHTVLPCATWREMLRQ